MVQHSAPHPQLSPAITELASEATPCAKLSAEALRPNSLARFHRRWRLAEDFFDPRRRIGIQDGQSGAILVLELLAQRLDASLQLPLYEFLTGF